MVRQPRFVPIFLEASIWLNHVCNIARMISDLPETTPEIMDARMRAEYKRYKVVKLAASEGRKDAVAR